MKKIILSIMALAALAACQKSEELTHEEGGSKEIVFTSVISTRVSGTSWDEDDEIGVYMYEHDNTNIYPNSENVHYITLNKGIGQFFSFDPLIYPKKNNLTVDYIAYYPFAANCNNCVITLNTADQTTEKKIKAQDFMVTSLQNHTKDYTPKLSFTRKMSKIVINVDRKETEADAMLSDITLSNVTLDGSFTISNSDTDRENAKVAKGETTGDISLFFNEESSTIEAIIIPQEVSTKLALLIDGELFKATIAGNFAENAQYSYNLALGANGAKLSAGSISEWGQSESGDMPTTQIDYESKCRAADVNADNIPIGNIWNIVDEGTITEDQMKGVKAALDAASKQGRIVEIKLSNATSVDEGAFKYWRSLTSIDLPQVTSVGDLAFWACSALTEIKNLKVSVIHGSAFRNTNISSFDFDGVTSIEESSFYACKKLTEIKNLKVKTIPNMAFAHTPITSFDFDGVTRIEISAFSYCSNLKSVTNFKLGSIFEYVFIGTGLTSFDFTGVKYIDSFAFSECADLKEVTNFKVKRIEEGVFNETGLTSFNFDGVISIARSAFSNCSDLTNIELPSTVTSIGTKAFYEVNATVTLNWTGDDIITYNADSNSFTPLNNEIHIPAGTTEAYTAKGWGVFTLIEKTE